MNIFTRIAEVVDRDDLTYRDLRNESASEPGNECETFAWCHVHEVDDSGRVVEHARDVVRVERPDGSPVLAITVRQADATATGGDALVELDTVDTEHGAVLTHLDLSMLHDMIYFSGDGDGGQRLAEWLEHADDLVAMGRRTRPVESAEDVPRLVHQLGSRGLVEASKEPVMAAAPPWGRASVCGRDAADRFTRVHLWRSTGCHDDLVRPL